MKKLVYVWLISLVLIGWVYLVWKLHESSYAIQNYVMLFLIAPVFEELIFRYFPLKIGTHLSKYMGDRGWINIVGIFANLYFAVLHIPNHMYGPFPQYYAIVIQGILGLCCWHVCRKYGLTFAILLHIKYNLFAYFIL